MLTSLYFSLPKGLPVLSTALYDLFPVQFFLQVFGRRSAPTGTRSACAARTRYFRAACSGSTHTTSSSSSASLTCGATRTASTRSRLSSTACTAPESTGSWERCKIIRYVELCWYENEQEAVRTSSVPYIQTPPTILRAAMRIRQNGSARSTARFGASSLERNEWFRAGRSGRASVAEMF